MSFTRDDRKIRPENGKSFPSQRPYDGEPFVRSIAAALRADFGTTPSAVKRLARIVDANERSVRNWLEEKNGPSGEHFVRLMHHSDAVFEVALRMASRSEIVDRKALSELRSLLASAIAGIDAAVSEPP